MEEIVDTIQEEKEEISNKFNVNFTLDENDDVNSFEE